MHAPNHRSVVQRDDTSQQSRSSTDSGITPIRHMQNAMPALGAMVFTYSGNHVDPCPGKWAGPTSATAAREVVSDVPLRVARETIGIARGPAEARANKTQP